MNSIKGRPREKTGSSGARDLARYITDAGKAENVWCYNFDAVEPGAPDIELAIVEMIATQQSGKHADEDNMYHLIVSFPTGENPNDAALQDIAHHHVAALGMQGHHFIAAKHTNTDNVHLHIAISKINPTTNRRVTPWRDYIKRDLACRELELKHGLHRDNGLHRINADGTIERLSSEERKQAGARGNAKLIETHRGIESFQSWVKHEPANAVREALKAKNCSWAEVHTALGRYNLKIIERGNGLAVVDRDNPKLAASASQVGSFCKKSAMVSRLGEFQPAGEPVKAVSRYMERPTVSANIERQKRARELYDTYKGERDKRYVAKNEALAAQRIREKERFTAVKQEAQAKRQAVQAGSGSAAEKRAAYKVIAMDRVLQEQALREQHAEERARIREQYGRGENYRQFVTRKAQEGDEAALAALRSMRPEPTKAEDIGPALRHSEPSEPDDVLLPRGRSHRGLAVGHQVHSNGDVTYSLNGKSALRDEGRTIRVHNDRDTDTIELGLRLAQQKFGKTLTLTGDEDFKRLVVETAVERGIHVQFADPALDAYRLQLEQARAEQHEAARMQQSTSSPVERVAFAVPFNDSAEAKAMGLRWDSELRGMVAERGSQAEQEARQRWPLKGDEEARKDGQAEQHTLEHKGDSAPSGRSLPANADAYVIERNKTREVVQSVLPHRLAQYDESMQGSFQGLRNMSDGSKIALVECAKSDKKEMVVLRVDAEQAKQLEKVRKGTVLTCTQRERGADIKQHKEVSRSSRGRGR